MNTKNLNHLLWGILAVVGASCLGVVALRRGESISALWIVVAAASIYLTAFRYYSLYIAKNVMALDVTRATPAHINNDGLDFVPTNKHVLFGHHFAAIAGAGPLVGPVLAMQMGYLPGLLWLVVGVVLAGAVQDFIILFISSRRNASSLGDIIRKEMGNVAGTIASIGMFMIMIILLAVLAMIVVKALAESPWGMFTVMMTIPLAMFMGLYMRFLRPGKVLEISIIGLVSLIFVIWLGGKVAANPILEPAFTFSALQITWMLVGYGFVAASLPVWLLLAPRDYLSTFLKIGVIIALVLGIAVASPAVTSLKMPAITTFIDGTGPVWKGDLFPFLFIVIACGAVSGFHALISSGTTPKMVANETHIPYLGYGGMLVESSVAIMALVAAAILDPGIYFAMNSPAAVIGVDITTAAQTISGWGFNISSNDIALMAEQIGEHTILSRAGGAPTLAVGIAVILNDALPSGEGMMAFWYHFAILFEALFILTAVDAGTRVGRYMLQDLLGSFVPVFAKKEQTKIESVITNFIGTTGCVGAWGYFLYQGVVDPLGGINTLWPLFGIANQMLAAIALLLGTVVIFKMKKDKYAWVTILPATWLIICTGTAGLIKIFSTNPAVGFVAQANLYAEKLAQGEFLGRAQTIEQMNQVIINGYLNAFLTVLFLAVVFSTLFYAIKAILKARQTTERTDAQTDYVALSPEQQKIWA